MLDNMIHWHYIFILTDKNMYSVRKIFEDMGYFYYNRDINRLLFFFNISESSISTSIIMQQLSKQLFIKIINIGLS